MAHPTYGKSPRSGERCLAIRVYAGRFTPRETLKMNKDNFEGAVRSAVGHGEKFVGAATDDKATEARGAYNDVAGKAQSAWGSAKDAAKEMADSGSMPDLLPSARGHRKSDPNGFRSRSETGRRFPRAGGGRGRRGRGQLVAIRCGRPGQVHGCGGRRRGADQEEPLGRRRDRGADWPPDRENELGSCVDVCAAPGFAEQARVLAQVELSLARASFANEALSFRASGEPG